MTQVYFHCSNTKKVFVDYCGAVVDDLAVARDHATRVVESVTSERTFCERTSVPFCSTRAAHPAKARLIAGEAAAQDSSAGNSASGRKRSEVPGVLA